MNDKYIIGGATNGKVLVWDVHTQALIFEKYAPQETLTNESIVDNPYLIQSKATWFDIESNYFNAIAGDGTYRIWSIDDGRKIIDKQVVQEITLAEISPDASTIAYVDGENELHIVAIYDLIHNEISLKLDEFVTEIEFRTTLTNLLNDNDIDTFITTLEAERGVAISETYADDLVVMANLLIEVETTP